MIAVRSKSFFDNVTLMGELSAAFPGEEFSADLEGAQAAIIGLEPINSVTLALYPSLRFIAKFGVGMDNIDLEACERNWVRVLWTPGVNAHAVAEHTLGLMLALKRNIHKNATLLKKGVWNKDGGSSIEDLLIGIIGYGRVGQKVASCFTNKKNTVTWNDIDSLISKEQIYRECDIITLHVPLTPDTRHMINAKTLALMKPSAVLINTSRGEVVNQADLKEALKNKVIAGAALDVFEDEPCTDRELLNMENVICTPHTAGNSEQAVLAMGRAAIENLKRMVKP